MTANTRTHPNGSALATRLDKLEEQMAVQEQRMLKFAGALAGVLAQQLQPQMQQSIVAQLMGTPPPMPPMPPDTPVPTQPEEMK